jgi:hypothetical protein
MDPPNRFLPRRAESPFSRVLAASLHNYFITSADRDTNEDISTPSRRFSLAFGVPNLPCAGNVGLPPLPCMLVCALPVHVAHKTAGAARIWHSLLPLRGRMFVQTSGRSCREKANVCWEMAVQARHTRCRHPHMRVIQYAAASRLKHRGTLTTSLRGALATKQSMPPQAARWIASAFALRAMADKSLRSQ